MGLSTYTLCIYILDRLERFRVNKERKALEKLLFDFGSSVEVGYGLFLFDR